MNENKLKLQEGGVKPLSGVLRSPFVEVQREAGRALANLAASGANQAMIIEGGGINCSFRTYYLQILHVKSWCIRDWKFSNNPLLDNYYGVRCL